MNQEPLVTIVIPTYNSSATLEPLLRSVQEQTLERLELIIVDNHSTDNTLEIAQRYTSKVFCQGPERSAQRNRGAKEATGTYLLFLDSDMQLTTGVVEHVVNTFLVKSEKKALIIPEESFGEGFWAACKTLERSFYVGVAWMEAARAFRTDSFREIGGYDENNTGTEDYDLPHRIEERYGESSIGRIEEFILHNEGRISLIRSCKKKFYYARKLDIYAAKSANKKKFTLQANPLKRYFLFLEKPKQLFKNPVLGFGMLFMKSCEMISGVIGYFLRKRNNDLINSIYK